MILWFRVHAVFELPLDVEGENRPARGFFQEFGCTAPSLEEAKALVEGDVSDESTSLRVRYRLSYEYEGEIAPEAVQSEILMDEDIAASIRIDPLLPGVWYASGRFFYCEE